MQTVLSAMTQWEFYYRVKKQMNIDMLTAAIENLSRVIDAENKSQR